MRRSFILAVALAGAAVPGSALAQAEGARATLPTDWTVTVGVDGRVLPAFQGSDHYLAAPFPTFDLREAGTPRRFSSPRDGFGVAIVNVGQFRLGPTANVVLPRRRGDDAAVATLGAVSWAVEVGAFAEYWPWQWLRTRAEVRQGIGGHSGVVADLTADVVVPATPALTLSAGPRMTLATAAALQPYFGVTPAQSATSGLPVFQTQGGLRSYGFGAQARYDWSKQWASTLFVEYDRLTGDAARSPIVTTIGSPDQVTFGVGLSYTFDIHLR